MANMILSTFRPSSFVNHLKPTNIYMCHFNVKNVTFCQQSEFLHSADSQNRQQSFPSIALTRWF